jgi:two-component system nitrogen regulation response regulator GlnG
MPFDLQTRLLRVLADGQFYRVGGHNPMRSSVRVIAATHQELEARVKAGPSARPVHRLNVIRLRLPALRERAEDVPPLTRFFLQKSARELGVEGKRLTDAAIARLMQFQFRATSPAREHLPLADRDGAGPARRAQGPAAGAAAGRAARASVAATPRAASAHPSSPDGLDRAAAAIAGAPGASLRPPTARGVSATTERPWLAGLEDEAREMLRAGEPMVWDALTRKFEAQLIVTALETTRGRRIEAAQKLGIGRNTITRKIQELGLDDK